jgi:trans-aconitate methyltransferase
MSPIDFTEISRRYEKDSLVQKAAAEILFGLLELGPLEDVLDLGCGTGHLAHRISQVTAGRIVGIDPSAGMVEQARAKHGGERIRFEVRAAEDLEAREQFDAIFCNSALQWFKEPHRALAACERALRGGGRMAIQAPARHDYCPNFLLGLADVARHPGTAATFARFQSPWFFLETAEAYAEVLREAGFEVPFARMETTRTRHSKEQAINIFESGAAAGYLNPSCYEVPLPAGYVESVRQILADSFQAQAGADGQVELVFNRIYLLAVKRA